MIAVEGPRPPSRIWTRTEYHKASKAGIFQPEERLELLNGEVLQKMSPQSDPHAFAVTLMAQILRESFGRGFHVREEKPLVLSDLSEPEPDVVVVRGSLLATPLHPTPSNAVLVVEVSASTLPFDQGEKATAYAGAGISEYWILNLAGRRLEVRRDPGKIEADQYGYRSLQLLLPGAEISPLSLPDARIQVAELMPTSGADEEA